MDITVIKEKMKSTWANGDFGMIARSLMPAAENFVGSLKIPKGSGVLDVACGSGNLALIAAWNGAKVKGLDIVEDLIRQAKERAEESYLDIQFETGDAEDLPYSDNEFDYVISMFGSMFCPRPEIAAKELFRVCRQGGIVAMANWVPYGFAQDFFGTIRSFAPPAPAGMSSPNEWGDKETVSRRFNGLAESIKFTKKSLHMIFPLSSEGTVEFFIKYFGPAKSVYDNLDNEKRMKFQSALNNVFSKHNASKDHNTALKGDYMEVVAVKA